MEQDHQREGKSVESDLPKVDQAANFEQSQEEGKILSTRLVALFVIGALVGITLKTHAVKNITMGYEDFKIGNFKSDFLLNKKDLEESAQEEQTQEESGEPVSEEDEQMENESTNQ